MVFDRHVPVPSFGYSAPRASTDTPAPPRTATKLPCRAEVAGKAAAARMDELQGESNTFSKSYLYQKYGRPDHQGHPSTTPSPRASHQPTETEKDKQARLHKLLTKWVPRADEFYNVYSTLGLSNEEVEAIQDEIVSYRVQTAIAAGKRMAYTEPWKKSSQGGGNSGEVNKGTDEMDVGPADPFGLGLVSDPVGKGKGDGKGRESDAMDLLD